jgi:hypothetical protein
MEGRGGVEAQGVADPKKKITQNLLFVSIELFLLFQNGGLGISLEGTVEKVDGEEQVRLTSASLANINASLADINASLASIARFHKSLRYQRIRVAQLKVNNHLNLAQFEF